MLRSLVFRNLTFPSIDFIESTRITENRAHTPALMTMAAKGLSLLSFSESITDSVPTTTSHTPTQASAHSGISPPRSFISENKHDTVSSQSPSTSPQLFLHPSKSPSPSRAQPHPSALIDEGYIPLDILAATQQNIQEQTDTKDTSHSIPAQEPSDSPRTPNVYINGLPPHFPDESLYLMTREFGHVLSVRTFTRCVGEKMSGYGFVLCVIHSHSLLA